MAHSPYIHISLFCIVAMYINALPVKTPFVDQITSACKLELSTNAPNPYFNNMLKQCHTWKDYNLTSSDINNLKLYCTLYLVAIQYHCNHTSGIITEPTINVLPERLDEICENATILPENYTAHNLRNIINEMGCRTICKDEMNDPKRVCQFIYYYVHNSSKTPKLTSLDNKNDTKTEHLLPAIIEKQPSTSEMKINGVKPETTKPIQNNSKINETQGNLTDVPNNSTVNKTVAVAVSTPQMKAVVNSSINNKLPPDNFDEQQFENEFDDDDVVDDVNVKNEEENAEEVIKETNEKTDIVAKAHIMDETMTSANEIDTGESYFFTYFVLMCVISIGGYIAYHNKNKILGLIVEGRRNKRNYRERRPKSSTYRKLDTNLEEAINSTCNRSTQNVIY